jgi:hypothetical protein
MLCHKRRRRRGSKARDESFIKKEKVFRFMSLHVTSGSKNKKRERDEE